MLVAGCLRYLCHVWQQLSNYISLKDIKELMPGPWSSEIFACAFHACSSWTSCIETSWFYGGKNSYESSTWDFKVLSEAYFIWLKQVEKISPWSLSVWPPWLATSNAYCRSGDLCKGGLSLNMTQKDGILNWHICKNMENKAKRKCKCKHTSESKLKLESYISRMLALSCSTFTILQ